MRLLLAEDDRIVRITVADALDEAGYVVEAFADGTAAVRALEQGAFDLVLTDVRLPGVDGLALFRRARQILPDAGIILMTAYAHAEDAVAVMREGARDYLQKPFEMDELLLRVGRVRDEVAFRLRLRDGTVTGTSGAIQGEAAPMRRLRERVEAAAASDVSVLITGETGTGKDLCARTIHEHSGRAGRPFVVVNCAAIPETLLEAELFGHEKGAFTGALQRRTGRFEVANGGTLFLDEVGELSPASQAKVLRAIESMAFEPVGSNRTVRVDVRIIAATNRDLVAGIASGAFRKDLFYRLNVLDLQTPSLRACRSDVPLLAARYLSEIAGRQGRAVPDVEPPVLAALVAHDWPGNIRELIHALERAVALSRGGPIGLHHLPFDITVASAELPTAPAPSPGDEPSASLGEAVGQFEQQYILQALERTGGHKGRAAALLGISRKSLWERLRETGAPRTGQKS